MSHPSGRSGRIGAGTPPAGAPTSRPRSSPVRSLHQAKRPSGSAQTLLVHPDRFPAQLLPRSRPQIVGPHLRDAADRADQGEQARIIAVDHAGKPSSGAVKRRTQARSSLIGVEAYRRRPVASSRLRELPSLSTHACRVLAVGRSV